MFKLPLSSGVLRLLTLPTVGIPLRGEIRTFVQNFFEELRQLAP